MNDEQPVGSLADELRQLAAVLADGSADGVEGLLATIRENLDAGGDPGAEADVERIDIS